MFILACHVIDAVVTLLGRPDRVNAFSQAGDPAFPWYRDNTAAHFEYDGAMATVEATSREVHTGAARRLEVYVTKGSAILEPLEPPALRLALLPLKSPGGTAPRSALSDRSSDSSTRSAASDGGNATSSKAATTRHNTHEGKARGGGRGARLHPAARRGAARLGAAGPGVLALGSRWRTGRSSRRP